LTNETIARMSAAIVTENFFNRKRQRIDPPAMATPPPPPLACFDTSYGLDQFEQAWADEAESPTNYDKPAVPLEPSLELLVPLSRDPRRRLGELYKDSPSKESDDMDIEDDDVPPPPDADDRPFSLSPSPVPADKGESFTPPGPPPPDQPSGKPSGKKPKKGKVRAHKRDKQQEIASIVKLALKVPYKKNKISKNDYKCIMKQVVKKVYESDAVRKGSKLREDKITEMVAVYIKLTKRQKAKKKIELSKSKMAVTAE